MRRFFLCSQNNDSKNYGFYQSVFFMEARPNFAKTKRGASGGFLPRPLLLRLRHPNSEKRNQPKFCGILSPEHCFRFPRRDCFQKRFELCTMNTAIFRKGFLYQKYGRHEVPSVLNSPQKILNPKGFATQSVAPR